MALAPAAVGITTIIWVTLLFVTGIVSVASISSAIALPIAVFLIGSPALVLTLAVALSLFVIYAHRANIKRLMRGEEPSFRKKKEAVR